MEQIAQRTLPLYRLLQSKKYEPKSVPNFRLNGEKAPPDSEDYLTRHKEKPMETNFLVLADILSESVDTISELAEDVPMTINNDTELTINYDDYGVGYRPQWSDICSGCDEYFAMGSFFPHSTLKFLVKAVFKLASSKAVGF